MRTVSFATLGITGTGRYLKRSSNSDTEIFFDRGEQYDSRGPIVIAEDLESDRYIEIWNVVFSQYNAEPGVKPREEYNELPSKNIDTGCGLERLCSTPSLELN